MNPPRFFACYLVAVFPWFTALLPAAGADRIALVIGNDEYPADSSLPVLKNCVNDARLVAKTLKGVGFEVIEVYNADLSTMDEELTRFEGKITKGGTALIYFAGHGIEFEKKNYLMASNAKLQARSRLTREAMEAEVFATAMLLAGAKSSFLLLDCCRKKPPAAEWAGRERQESGLAEISVDGDLVISMAAAPGKQALEPAEAGRNSPYATALAKWIPSGLKHRDVFAEVRKEVFTTTDGQQRPWDAGSFIDDFYFAAPVVPMGQDQPPTPPMRNQRTKPLLIVPDDFDTIQIAVDAALENDVIVIRPGLYPDAVKIENRKNLEVRGENAQTTILRNSLPVMVSVTNSENIKISNLSLEFSGKPLDMGGNKEQGYDLSLISTASPDQLPSHGKSLIAVTLVGGKIHVRIFDVEGTLVIDKPEEKLNPGPELDALRELFKKNPLPTSSSMSELDRSEVIENAESTTGYAQALIHIEGGNHTSVEKCRFNGNNGVSGIVVEGGRHRASTNQIENCTHGISFSHVTTSGVIEANTVTNSLFCGIRSGQGAQTRIISNTCSGNGRATKDGSGFSYCGIWAGATVLEVSDNILIKNINFGIWAEAEEGYENRESKIKILNNRVDGNKGTGIELHGMEFDRVEKNQCLENGGNGICIFNGARGLVTDNVCNNNTWSGIASDGTKTKPSIIANTCNNNLGWGIAVGKVTICPEFRDNRSTGNGYENIARNVVWD